LENSDTSETQKDCNFAAYYEKENIIGNALGHSGHGLQPRRWEPSRQQGYEHDTYTNPGVGQSIPVK
jgi:hypothetical protein